MSSSLSPESLALPADAIRAGAAIEILAGRSLDPRSRVYGRHLQRLRAEAERGRVTSYVLPGRVYRWYSRDEVRALKASYDDEGITMRPSSQARAASARVTRMAPRGLIDTCAMAKAAGVREQTARLWGPKGLYGARKIEGQWFFERDQVPTSRRARPEPEVEVQCAVCHRPLKRSAAKVRAARAKAERAGRTAIFFHSHHRGARSLVSSKGGAIRRTMSPEARAVFRELAKRRWDAGEFSREEQAERCRRTMIELHKSALRHVALVEKWYRGRWGKALSEEQRADLARRAHGRASKDSARSREARALEARVSELWRAGITHDEIADQCLTSARNVRLIVKRLKLPRRQPGRPRKIGTKLVTGARERLSS